VASIKSQGKSKLGEGADSIAWLSTQGSKPAGANFPSNHTKIEKRNFPRQSEGIN